MMNIALIVVVLASLTMGSIDIAAQAREKYLSEVALPFLSALRYDPMARTTNKTAIW